MRKKTNQAQKFGVIDEKYKVVLSKLKEMVGVSVGFLVIEPWGCQEFRKQWGKSVQELGCSIAR